MQSGPPRALEFALYFLIPPACRDYVLGDLHERYRTPSQYLSEAVSAVPLVIMSRIRRTTDPQALLLEAFTLYGSFAGAAWYFGELSFLYEHSGFLKLALPTLVALTMLLVANAYSNPETRTASKPLLACALAVSIAFLGQALIFDTNQNLAIPFRIVLCGSCLSLLFLSAARILLASNTGPRVS